MGYLSNLGAAILGRTASPSPAPPLSQAQALATLPPALPTVSLPAQVPLERAYDRNYGKRIWPNEQKSGVRTPFVPVSLRWLPEDVEAVWADAEIGQLYQLASLVRGMRLNGTIDGLMSVRSSIVRLPIVFVGDPWLCSELRGVPPTYTDDGILIDPGVPGAFERMCPAEGLKELIYTGTMAGVAPFEMVDADGGPDPILHPRDLHFLRYDWGGRQWMFQGSQDAYRWEPGNGRAGLYSPGGIDRPWQGGAWLPCAFPHVAALAALFDRLRWQALLADPLKYIKSGPGASQAYLKELQWFIDTQWARAPGIALPPGYEPGYAESAGKGWEVYIDAENRADRMVQIALAGQVQTVDGGTGFSNLDLFDAIAESFIQDTATSLARCLTKQVIEPWVERRYGLPRSRAPKLAWDIRSPKRKRADADFLTATASMVTAWNAALDPYGDQIDYQAYLAQNALTLPVRRKIQGQVPQGQPAPTPAPSEPAPPAAAPPDPPSDEIPITVDESEWIAEQYGQQRALADGLYGIDRCVHQRTHLCERCGVQRVYEPPERLADGSVVHPIVWRPILAPPESTGFTPATDPDPMVEVVPEVVPDAVQEPPGSDPIHTGPPEDPEPAS